MSARPSGTDRETFNIHYGALKSLRTIGCRGCLLCALALAACIGCGRNGRMALEGTVTLDGQPLERGAIRFRPLADTAGPTAGGDIVQGKFVVTEFGGAFAGEYQVQIVATKPTGRKVLDPRSKSQIDEYAQFLPARYNSRSQLRAEVTADGPNRFEFALVSSTTSSVRK